jgi:hypothetical protein
MVMGRNEYTISLETIRYSTGGSEDVHSGYYVLHLGPAATVQN